jgi:hypothetical protein
MNGEWHDEIGYGMLITDWKNLRGRSGSMDVVKDVGDNSSTSGESSSDE